MTRTTDHADLVLRRRELVARFRLRQMSVREIAKALAEQVDKESGKPIFVNPKTGEPINHTQVVRDLKAIRVEWLKHRNEALDQHAARQLAELAELKREAVKSGDLRAWIAAIRQEAELLGTNKPAKIEIRDWREEAHAAGVDVSAVFEEMVRAVMARAEVESDADAGRTDLG